MNKNLHPSHRPSDVAFHIPQGEIVMLEGTRLQFKKRYPSGNYEFVNPEDGEPFIIEVAALLKKWLENKLVLQGNGDLHPLEQKRLEIPLDQLTKKESAEIEFWLACVKAFYAVHPRPKKTKKGLTPILERIRRETGDKRPRSWQVFQSKIRKFEMGGRDPRALISLNRYKGNPHQSRLLPIVDQIIDNAISEVYLTPDNYNRKVFCGRVLADIYKYNRNVGLSGPHIPVPDRSTLYRRLHWIDGYLELYTREGKEAADQKYRPAYAGKPATRIGEVYEIDHHKCDTHLCDAKTGLMLGRPWLTLVVDRFSRAIVGFYLSFATPSWHSTAQALRMAIMPKEPFLASDGQTRLVWFAHGVCEWIVTDNAPELKSPDLVRAAEAVQIGGITWAPRYKPNYKGIVERFFGSMEEDFGQSLPNAAKQPNRKASPRKKTDPKHAITLDEYRARFIEWVLQVYNRSLHTKLHCSPEMMWREGAKLHPPRLPRSARDLNVLMMYVKERTLHQYGIELNNLRYNSSDVARLRSDFGGSVKLPVRFDRSELGYIYIQHPTSGELYKIPCTTPMYADGLSLDVHLAVWETMREKGISSTKDADLVIYRDNIIREAQKARGHKKLTIRKQSEILLSGFDDFTPGKVIVNRAESQLNAFDQMMGDRDNAAPSPSHTVEFPSSLEPDALPRTVGKLNVVRVQKPKPKDRSEIPHPKKISIVEDEFDENSFHSPKIEPISPLKQSYSPRVTTGLSGIPMTRLDAHPRNASSDTDSEDDTN
ncbi:Mu transposase C-terminal domain-containing protein [Parvibaculum sp.]|uniref:Mu transposase C-terminal domain-containing protein n=1 Tax=Parvibaculum sp. TaxID=2024848 RepID=UPI003298549D